MPLEFELAPGDAETFAFFMIADAVRVLRRRPPGHPERVAVERWLRTAQYRQLSELLAPDPDFRAKMDKEIREAA